ncbi:hypothetical protein ACLK1G_24530 [Pseudomonas sp. NR3]|uniref:hypothetical protein n=1 Tax=Pseudomonas sp. NR3 TaxID=3155978 RepID=UPI003B68130C
MKFKDIDALVRALKTAGLKQVSGTTVIPVSPLRLMDRHPRLTDPGMLTELRLFDNLDALTAHLDEAIGLKRVQSA